MPADCKQRAFLEYHSFSVWAQERVEEGIFISDDEYDRLCEANEAERRREDRERVAS